MKRLFLICLILCFLAMKCKDEDTLNCSDCYDIESVLKETNSIVERHFEDNIRNYKVAIFDKIDTIIVSYTRNDFKYFGGGLTLKISKNDCKIIEYKVHK